MHSNNFDLQLKFVFCYYFFYIVLTQCVCCAALLSPIWATAAAAGWTRIVSVHLRVASCFVLFFKFNFTTFEFLF